MLESTRTSTPVPLNYHKNITDLTTSKSNTVSSNNPIIGNMSRSNVNGVTGSRKRKLQTHSNINLNHSSEDAPSPSKIHHKQVQQQQQLQMQHSNAIHSRQCDYLNSNNHNVNINNINSNQSHHDNNNSTANNEHVVDNEDDDDDGAGYSTSFSHLQTTHINAGINSNGNGNGNTSSISHNCKLNNGSSNSSAPIDEYGVFGEYVAITIRKLKTSKAKIVVKHLINNLLYEAEMGKYDQGISSCKEPPELYKM